MGVGENGGSVHGRAPLSVDQHVDAAVHAEPPSSNSADVKAKVPAGGSSAMMCRRHCRGPSLERSATIGPGVDAHFLRTALQGGAGTCPIWSAR